MKVELAIRNGYQEVKHLVEFGKVLLISKLKV